MKIAIAGAGAMGCRFGYMLTKTGQEVTLIDEWPAHIEAIQKNGLKVVDGENTDTIDIKIIRPEEATEEVDVVIAFTKSMKLGEMLEKIKAIIHEDTKVLCLLNGLGHEDTMAKYVPRKNIIMGVTIWTAGLIEPGVARLGGTGTVEMQAADPSGVAIAKELVEVMGKEAVLANFELFAKLMPDYLNCLQNNLKTWQQQPDAQIRKAVADEAHKIKGALASVGLRQLQQIAQLAQTDNGEVWERSIALWVEQIASQWQQDLALTREWVIGLN